LGGERFLGYLQNHDQIGNRAMGERTSQLMGMGKLKIGAALVLASPFVPMLFQGEEWGASAPFFYFTDYQEPELAKAVRDGRCREFAAFGWKPEDTADPQARETFEKSKLNWLEVSRSPHVEILEWHKKLIQLRRTESALNGGRLGLVKIHFDEPALWLVMERGAISVACNLATHSQRIPLRNGKHRTLLASAPEMNAADDGVTLRQESIAIFKME
jgi:maltooligosyltrehalose trehalohydrolase